MSLRFYTDALNHLRSIITEIENESIQSQCEFYGCIVRKDDPQRDELFESYLKHCNDNLLQCNNLLRRNEVQLEVIDSEARLIDLITKIRDHEIEPSVLEFITTFWKRLKTCLESYLSHDKRIQALLVDKMTRNHHSFSPLKALKSHKSVPNSSQVTHAYVEGTMDCMNGVKSQTTSIQLLIKSFGHSLQRDLFVTSNFTERVLVSCDIKAFPVLRVVPDVSVKFERVLNLLLKWLDLDENYVVEMKEVILTTKNTARERVTQLKTERDNHKKLGKEVKAAYVQCQSNKTRLERLQQEIIHLNQTEEKFRSERAQAEEELHLKQSMADFLKLSMTQTRRNYSLQMQQRRLAQQLDQLDEAMIKIEIELRHIDEDINVKTQQKQVVEDKVSKSEEQYKSVKQELDKFSETLNRLQLEVAGIQDDVVELEAMHALKISPEQVDDFYEKPAPVKLAPSLQKKIKKTILQTAIKSSRDDTRMSDPLPATRPSSPTTIQTDRSIAQKRTSVLSKLNQRRRSSLDDSSINKKRGRVMSHAVKPPPNKEAFTQPTKQLQAKQLETKRRSLQDVQPTGKSRSDEKALAKQLPAASSTAPLTNRQSVLQKNRKDTQSLTSVSSSNNSQSQLPVLDLQKKFRKIPQPGSTRKTQIPTNSESRLESGLNKKDIRRISSPGPVAGKSRSESKTTDKKVEIKYKNPAKADSESKIKAPAISIAKRDPKTLVDPRRNQNPQKGGMEARGTVTTRNNLLLKIEKPKPVQSELPVKAQKSSQRHPEREKGTITTRKDGGPLPAKSKQVQRITTNNSSELNPPGLRNVKQSDFTSRVSRLEPIEPKKKDQSKQISKNDIVRPAKANESAIKKVTVKSQNFYNGSPQTTAQTRDAPNKPGTQFSPKGKVTDSFKQKQMDRPPLQQKQTQNKKSISSSKSIPENGKVLASESNLLAIIENSKNEKKVSQKGSPVRERKQLKLQRALKLPTQELVPDVLTKPVVDTKSEHKKAEVEPKESQRKIKQRVTPSMKMVELNISEKSQPKTSPTIPKKEKKPTKVGKGEVKPQTSTTSNASKTSVSSKVFNVDEISDNTKENTKANPKQFQKSDRSMKDSKSRMDMKVITQRKKGDEGEKQRKSKDEKIPISNSKLISKVKKPAIPKDPPKPKPKQPTVPGFFMTAIDD